MQLIEYFLWNNLKNTSLNRYYSKIAWWIVVIQPFLLILMIQGWMRYGMLILYGLFGLLFFFMFPNFGGNKFHTSVAKNGHLNWEWMGSSNLNNYKLLSIHLVFIFFYVVPLLLVHNTWLSVFTIMTLLLSIFFYYRQNTWGSMWCWSVNVFLLYFVIHILLVQPFLEYNALC